MLSGPTRMLAYRAILSRIYRLKPFFSNCKMSLYSKYFFLCFILPICFSLSSFYYELHSNTPLIYTKISFIKLMFINFLLTGGHVDQITKILGCQAKLPAVITFVEMHQQPCHLSWSSYKVNFVFWIL